VIANKEEKLDVLEARSIALLQELDCVAEEIAQVSVELDKDKSLL
jgi:hypothetical protein